MEITTRNVPLAFAVVATAMSLGCSSSVNPGDPPQAQEAARLVSPSAKLARAASRIARPASVPGEFVPTPNGWFHQSCIEELGPGEIAHRSGHIERADGTTRKLPACAYPHYTRLGEMVTTPLRAGETARENAEPAPTINGWAANANATSNPVNWMEAIFTVPSTPRNFEDQVDFFFPGLEPLAGDPLFIMQPVLAYEGGSWSAASWNCCVDGTTVKSPDIAVSPGDSLLGQMIGTDCSVVTGVCGTWYVYTRDQTTGVDTTLSTTAQNEVMDWAFPGAVEVYGVNACADLPANGSIDFTYVQLQVLSGSRPDAWTSWVNTDASPDCRMGVATSEFDAKFTWLAN